MVDFANFARGANSALGIINTGQQRRAEEQRQQQLNNIISGIGQFSTPTPLVSNPIGGNILASSVSDQPTQEQGILEQSVTQQQELDDPVEIINQVQSEVAENQLKLSEFVQRGGDVRRAQFLSNQLDGLAKKALRDRFGGNVTQVISSLRNRIATDKGDESSARSLGRIAIERNPELRRFFDPESEDFSNVIAERASALGLDSEIAKGELDVSLKDQVDDNALSNDLSLQAQKTADSEQLERLKQSGKEAEDNRALERKGRAQTTVEFKVPSGFQLSDPADPSKGVVPIPGGPQDRKNPGDAAKVQLLRDGEKSFNNFTQLLIDGNGEIDRGLILAMDTNAPGTNGRQANAEILNSVEARLRAESGAAVPDSEVKRAAKRFIPTSLDNDATIRAKLSNLQSFLEETQDIIDPTGQLGLATPTPSTKFTSSSGIVVEVQ